MLLPFPSMASRPLSCFGSGDLRAQARSWQACPTFDFNFPSFILSLKYFPSSSFFKQPRWLGSNAILGAVMAIVMILYRLDTTRLTPEQCTTASISLNCLCGLSALKLPHPWFFSTHQPHDSCHLSTDFRHSQSLVRLSHISCIHSGGYGDDPGRVFQLFDLT